MKISQNAREARLTQAGSGQNPPPAGPKARRPLSAATRLAGGARGGRAVLRHHEVEPDHAAPARPTGVEPLDCMDSVDGSQFRHS
jgi:hypothetical protein